MRMGMRRFTRMTDAFSKKVDNHRAAMALSLHALQLREGPKDAEGYPGLEAGVADHVWSLEEVAALSN